MTSRAHLLPELVSFSTPGSISPEHHAEDHARVYIPLVLVIPLILLLLIDIYQYMTEKEPYCLGVQGST